MSRSASIAIVPVVGSIDEIADQSEQRQTDDHYNGDNQRQIHAAVGADVTVRGKKRYIMLEIRATGAGTEGIILAANRLLPPRSGGFAACSR